MKLFIILFGCLAAADAFAFYLPEAKLNSTALKFENRISSGSTAYMGQFPYQIFLIMGNDTKILYTCGGSLIGTEWVLTAASCTVGIKIAFIYLGSLYRTDSEVQYVLRNDKFIIHPEFNSKTYENDIALIKTPKTRLSQRIQIVRLPSVIESHLTYSNENAIATGWGKTSAESTNDTAYLQWTRLQIMYDNVCHLSYKALTDSQICATSETYASICTGDNGGPLVVESTKVLIGVSSFNSGKSCGSGYPSVFTRITSYLCWIQFVTGIYY